MSMLKVMIVDDEILTRIGMRSIIPWEEYGLQVVGEDRKSTRLNSSH